MENEELRKIEFIRGLLPKGKASVVIDGQFGSTGKGLLCGLLGRYGDIDIASIAASPNAGHTYMDEYIGKVVTHLLPMSAVVGPTTHAYLNAGSVIEWEALLREIRDTDFDQSIKDISIHPRAARLRRTDRDVEADDKMLQSISSTNSGTGNALARRISRRLASTFDGPEEAIRALQSDIHMDYGLLSWAMEHTCRVLIETTQGVDLGLYEGMYPHCTSRPVNVAQALSDAGLHPKDLGTVFMTLRTFPIRVGGPSGPFFEDSQELDWDQFDVEPERTTVTKKIRRIATFSFNQYRKNCELIRPDVIFLNFCNYMQPEELHALIARMLELYQPKELLLGYGPTCTDVARWYAGRPLGGPDEGGRSGTG